VLFVVCLLPTGTKVATFRFEFTIVLEYGISYSMRSELANTELTSESSEPVV
jgi:hypothetical protein